METKPKQIDPLDELQSYMDGKQAIIDKAKKQLEVSLSKIISTVERFNQLGEKNLINDPIFDGIRSLLNLSEPKKTTKRLGIKTGPRTGKSIRELVLEVMEDYEIYSIDQILEKVKALKPDIKKSTLNTTLSEMKNKTKEIESAGLGKYKTLTLFKDKESADKMINQLDLKKPSTS